MILLDQQWRPRSLAVVAAGAKAWQRLRVRVHGRRSFTRRSLRRVRRLVVRVTIRARWTSNTTARTIVLR
jgi:hypothetical protein